MSPCGDIYYYIIQGLCGHSRFPPIPQHLSSAKVVYVPSKPEAPWHWGQEQRRTKAEFLGTGDFRVVLGKLVIEAVLSKG